MNAVKKALASMAIAGVIAFGGATAANATPVAGGDWSYGVDYLGFRVWSNFYHPSRGHFSTACNSNSCTRSKYAWAGAWSWASQGATWGGNRAYYSF